MGTEYTGHFPTGSLMKEGKEVRKERKCFSLTAFKFVTCFVCRLSVALVTVQLGSLFICLTPVSAARTQTSKDRDRARRAPPASPGFSSPVGQGNEQFYGKRRALRGPQEKRNITDLLKPQNVLLSAQLQTATPADFRSVGQVGI